MDDSNRNKNIIKPCKNSIEKNNLWIITFKMGAKYIWFLRLRGGGYVLSYLS